MVNAFFETIISFCNMHSPKGCVLVLLLGDQFIASSESQITKTPAFFNWHKQCRPIQSTIKRSITALILNPQNGCCGQWNKCLEDTWQELQSWFWFWWNTKHWPQNASSISAKQPIAEHARCWEVPFGLSPVSEVICNDHSPMLLFRSCSRRWDYWGIIRFFMVLLLDVQPEEIERTMEFVACNAPVSGIGHNAEVAGMCSLRAGGLCVHVLNSYAMRFVECKWLHLCHWRKIDFNKCSWTLWQKCLTINSWWAAINVGGSDNQAERKSGSVIKFLWLWATSL